MGLDMYLNKQIYFYAWSDSQKSKLAKGFRAGFLDSIGVNLDTVKSIEAQACYWRKVNSVHGWFVANCQDGNDDCGTYHVSDDQIRKLYRAVCNVLDARDTPGEEEIIAENDLEPTSGCFFGGNNIDQYYWEDLEYTKDKLKGILEDLEKQDKKREIRIKEIDEAKARGEQFPEPKELEYGIDYYYHSSW
jgi:hypothetical protein